MTVIKVVINHLNQKSLTSYETDLTIFFFFFTHTTQNQIQTLKQPAVERRQDQHKLKYRGIIIFIKRNTAVNTGDLKMLHKKYPNKVDLKFLQNVMCFAFNLMLDWRAMTITVHLAPWTKGHSLSVQCSDFCLHAILFLKLIQTRPVG